MNWNVVTVSCATLLLPVAPAAAEDFDFEVGLAIDSARSDFTAFSVDMLGMPVVPQVTTDGYFDNDEVTLAGTWYFNGLSDTDGPRARAAFLNRASSVSFLYARGDGESGVTVNPPPPIPILSGTDTTTDTMAARLRYVDRASGWFGTASVGVVSTDTSFEAGNSFDSDATLYSVGLGKYLGAATAVEANIGSADGDGGEDTTYGVALMHVGALGERWQYGVDVAYSRVDNSFDDGRISLRPSLYPNRDVEIGIELAKQQFAGGFDVTEISGFTSWFVRPHVAISARYGTVDNDDANNVDTDSYSFGVGIDVRF